MGENALAFQPRHGADLTDCRYGFVQRRIPARIQPQPAHPRIRFDVYAGPRAAGGCGGRERGRIVQTHNRLGQTQRKQLRKIIGRRIPQYQDMRTDTRVAQLFGLIQVRHGEVCGAQSLQASRGIGRAVAVCVRLDYRHDRRARPASRTTPFYSCVPVHPDLFRPRCVCCNSTSCFPSIPRFL